MDNQSYVKGTYWLQLKGGGGGGCIGSQQAVYPHGLQIVHPYLNLSAPPPPSPGHGGAKVICYLLFPRRDVSQYPSIPPPPSTCSTQRTGSTESTLSVSPLEVATTQLA